MNQPSAVRARLRGARHRVAGFPSRIPLRTQLVAAMLVLGAIAMVLFGFVGTERLRSTLEGNLDSRLTSFAAPHGGGGGFGGFDPGGSSTGSVNSTWEAAVDLSGRWLGVTGTASSTPFPGFLNQTSTAQTRPDLPRITTAFVAAHPGPLTVTAVGSGARWRVLVEQGPVNIRTNGTDIVVQGSIIYALSEESVDGPVSALERIDLILGVVVLLLLGLAAWLVVRASLRPLVDVEQTAEAIAAGDLSRRVPVRSDRTEVGRLGAALNTMLGHIEAAFAARSQSEAAALATAEQMRRFAADASHELRTPLTSIRGFAELSRSGVVPPGPDTERAMERIESEAIRMTGLVEDLLLLARLDQQRPLERNYIDLLGIAADAVHDAAAIAPDHETTLVVAELAAGPGSAEPIVLGDEPRLRQVVTNLVANALHHTPPGTHVRVGVRVDGGVAVLEVADDGPGLAPADARKVFERFYRADSSRARTSGGAGLGLSIVNALVSAHRGTVDLQTAPGQGARFSVRLPLATAAADFPATDSPSADVPAAASTGADLPTPGRAARPAGPRRRAPIPLGPGFLPPPEAPAVPPDGPTTPADGPTTPADGPTTPADGPTTPADGHPALTR